MKKAISLLIFPLLLVSCKKNDAGSNAGAYQFEGRWRMVQVKDNSSGLAFTKPSNLPSNVELVFEALNAGTGHFSGNTPTNEIWKNDYSISAGNKITIPCLAMTKVMETSWGLQFVDHIRQSQEYSFADKKNLLIKTEQRILVFVKL